MQHTENNYTNIHLIISISTLNMNGLNSPSDRLSRHINIQDPTTCCLYEIHLIKNYQ